MKRLQPFWSVCSDELTYNGIKRTLRATHIIEVAIAQVSWWLLSNSEHAAYGVIMLMAFGSIIGGVVLKLLPIYCLIALLTSIPAWGAYQGIRRNAENLPALIQPMGMNVIVSLTTPILLSIGLFIG